MINPTTADTQAALLRLRQLAQQPNGLPLPFGSEDAKIIEHLLAQAHGDTQLLDDVEAFLRQVGKELPDAELGLSVQATTAGSHVGGPFAVRATVIGPDDSFTMDTARDAIRAALESQRA